MSIQIYNTLSRKKEEFIPMTPGKVKFYVCGPTVYNYIHIGNARSAVAFDTVRRYLEYRGFDVNYVSNFTDVDDKIIKAAKAENLTAKELSDKYIEAFIQDTQAINIKPATVHPRVMDNIEEIISFVEDLIEQDYAYEVEGDVYFRTEKFKDYGKLSNKTIEELIVGASQRTESEETTRKENPVDFALWKATKNPDEISWSSPWGQGRPGWHIECSVMSTKYLGDRLDIHGGGHDLEFPHHENEIAQSEAHSGHTFANYWMHNGFVTIGSNDEKMSKSLGNFVLLRDMLAEVDPLVIRYLLVSVHYRRPLRYDQETLQDAKNNVERLREVDRRLKTAIQQAGHLSSEEVAEWEMKLEEIESRFIKAMDDDFNTANGLTVIYDLVKEINIYLTQERQDKQVLESLHGKLSDLLEIFGLIFKEQSTDISERIKDLIEERNQARKDKNFARADEIRDMLKEEGIILDDTPKGTTWKLISE